MSANQYGDAVSDQKFVETWLRIGSPYAVAKELNIDPRACMHRRRKVEKKLNIELPTTSDGRLLHKKQPQVSEKVRARLTVENGCVFVGSDAHYWPEIESAAHRAFVLLNKKLKPAANILNGDVIDGSTISRWPRIGWEHRPTVKQELEVAQDRLSEIDKANLNAKNFWTFGNHDSRFELNLAKLAPEYEGVSGFTLKEHFPRWQPCMSVMVNETCIVKHRWHNGVHAVYNNTLKGGISIVTGHLHSLKVTPWTDYNGDRYGVDTGTMADPWGPQFEAYMEDAPRNWRSGFAVLEFRNGVLMPPDLCQVIEDDAVWFRGQRIEV